MWPSCPAKDEEAGREEEGTGNGGDEAVFLLAEAVFNVIWDHVLMEV
jgi:hypothetical protein